jgi:hypothetical protein
MISKTNDQVMQEILQRTVRMETRMLQLGDHVGANLRSRQRIDIEPTPGSVVAYVDSMDVSFSRVMAEIRRSEHWKRCTALLGQEDVISVPIRMGHRHSHRPVGAIVVPVQAHGHVAASCA